MGQPHIIGITQHDAHSGQISQLRQRGQRVATIRRLIDKDPIDKERANPFEMRLPLREPLYHEQSIAGLDPCKRQRPLERVNPHRIAGAKLLLHLINQTNGESVELAVTVFGKGG